MRQDSSDNYVPADSNRTSCEALTAWITEKATDERPTIAEVSYYTAKKRKASYLWTTRAWLVARRLFLKLNTLFKITDNAHFVADSELLAKIASAPYTTDKDAQWKMGAFRYENTVFLFEYPEHRSEEELLGEYQREVFKRTTTKVGIGLMTHGRTAYYRKRLPSAHTKFCSLFAVLQNL